MKKSPKQIAAIIALIAIFALIIGFVFSAFQTNTDARNTFFALYFGIIAIPILAWVIIFCIGRLKGKHTMAEFFPEANASADVSVDTTSDQNQEK